MPKHDYRGKDKLFFIDKYIFCRLNRAVIASVQ